MDIILFMSNYLSIIRNYFLKIIDNITIKQANIFHMGIIFVFIVIFTSILMHEEYIDYTVMLQKEQKQMKQHATQNLQKTANTLLLLIENADVNPNKIDEVVKIFKDDVHRVIITDNKNNHIYEFNQHKNKKFTNTIFYTASSQKYKIEAWVHISSEDEFQEKKNEKLKAVVIKNILNIATLTFIVFAIVLGFYNILNMLLRRDTNAFLNFFEEAAFKRKMLDGGDIFFKDFKIMVAHVNKMVATINKQKSNLKKMNEVLEAKVKEKTANLEEINKNLLKEKKFSEDVLKAQKEFLRYTVHETNTPLSVILTSIELFVMKNKKDRQLSKIEAAAKNIYTIYDDLSYLVKKDQVNYPKRVIDFGIFLNGRIEFFSDVAEFSKLHFEYEPPQKALHVYFNETKLQRIIDNTLTNAIKYTLPNEHIEVSLKQEGLYIDFAVASKSKIIEDKEKIFEAYYREENQHQGFGLGLNLVKNIAQEEDVKIFLESNHERTLFRYRFKMMGE